MIKTEKKLPDARVGSSLGCAVSECPGEPARWLMECRQCHWSQAIGADCRSLFESRDLLEEVDEWTCPGCDRRSRHLADLADFHSI